MEREIKGKNEFLEFLKEENAVHKEKIDSLNHLLEQLQEENSIITQNIQSIREKVILLESKK